LTSTSKRQRELARRRAERQAERRAQRQRARRRRNILTSAGVFLLVLLVVLGFTVGRDLFDDDKKDGVDIADGDPSAEPSESEAPVVTACGAEKPKANEDKQFPKEPPLTIDKAKSYTAKITTSCGVIEVQMLADKAPKTVNSFKFLSEADFFDGTFCHRMTEGGLTVLQCGDPTGTGGGGPGYEFADENLAGATYTRGVVAMANSGPGTNGSQFFFVIQDSTLGPKYTPWGKVTKGLDVLDKILNIGITGGQGDGAPKERVYLEDFTVTTK
jgi:peptidyl-prolyl cis-trans isomerase B (cyclophilin B)